MALVELQCTTCGETFERPAKDVRQMQKRGSKPYCSTACVARRNSGGADDVKVCTGCGETKPLEAFWVQPRGLLGRTARCKECKAESVDREALSDYHRRYYLANRDGILARGKAHRSSPEGRAQNRANVAAWREQNLERARLNSRRWRIRKTYGLELEEYDAIVARGCAICGSHDGRIVGKRNGAPPPPARLCLDHDHGSGQVREALCHNCNSGLGLFADDPARLRAAAEYLEKHRLEV